MRCVEQSFVKHMSHGLGDLNAPPFGFEVCTTNQSLFHPRTADFLRTLGMKPHSHLWGFFQIIVCVGCIEPQPPQKFVGEVIDDGDQNTQVAFRRWNVLISTSV